MSRKKSKKVKDIEKGSLAVSSAKDPVDSNSSSTVDSTTKSLINQGEEQDKIKGRHFAFVVYPDSALGNWVEVLLQTGLSFVVSPLHDKDVNVDGTPKKAHYHVIVSWGNTTTYRSVRILCDKLKCPIPQVLRNCNGMYRYLTHKDNPEKYQYEEQPKAYNGWVRPLDSVDIASLKEEIWQMVYTEDCQEYGELLMVCHQRGSEYFKIASSNTLFFKSVCDGYRHNPIRTLQRRYMTTTGRDKEIIGEMLSRYIDLKTGEIISPYDSGVKGK